MASYVANGVDGSSRPFNIEVNSYTSLLDDYGDLEKCLNGEIALEEVKTSEQRSNATSISGYLEGNGDATGWSKYHSRSKGVELIQTLTENDQFSWLTPIFPQTTPTMETNLANLEKLEEERDSLKEQKRELAKAYGRIPVRRERLEGKKSELRVLEEQKKGLASWQAACR